MRRPQRTRRSDSDAGATDAADDRTGAQDGARFCDGHGQALYCADFDDDGGLSFWGTPNLTGGAVLELATNPSVSPPRSLRASLPLAGSSQRARLERTFGMMSATRLRATFSARLDTNATDDEPIFELDFGSYSVNVQIGNGIAKLSEYDRAGSDSTIEHLFARGPAMGAFHRYALDITLTRGSDGGVTASTARVEMDGTQVLADTPISLHRYLGSTFRLEYGFTGAATSTGEVWTVHLDDVLLESF
jgi:hypothetical protein